MLRRRSAVSTAPRYLPHYTVADHAAWEGDWELVDGVAVAMTPSPFGRHAERLSRLAASFWNAIDATGCPATVLAEIDWIVTNDTVVGPDLVVVCGPAPQRPGANGVVELSPFSFLGGSPGSARVAHQPGHGCGGAIDRAIPRAAVVLLSFVN
jgi:hypothetical protein